MHSLASATAPVEPRRRMDAGLRFVRRMYLPRAAGLVLGAVAIGAVLRENQAPGWTWALLAVTVLVWPHVAFLVGRRAADPYRTELRSLAVDSALGGAWIVLMKFNLLPSVLIFVMLSMDKIAVGGARFLARCCAAMLLGAAGAALVFGFEARPHTSMGQIVASLPLLIVYPALVGITTYRLARRVRAQNRELAEMSRTDGLSGLVNRRHWEEAVAAEFQRARRSRRPASLLMLDIDHFKAINDGHGHPAGDEVIRSVAAILKNAVRLQDSPGRYGGEEFGVLLPDTAADGALVIAERLRRQVADAVLEPTLGVRGTVSVGIAELEADKVSYADWISHADRALYAAKSAGRNRCETYRKGEAPAAAA